MNPAALSLHIPLAPTAPPTLGIAGFVYADLFEPARLRDLYEHFLAWFRAEAEADFTAYEAYRACGGGGMSPEATSTVLLSTAPHVSRFVAKLFGVEREAGQIVSETTSRLPIFRFGSEFVKKRVAKRAVTAATFTGSPLQGADVAQTLCRTAVALESEAASFGDARLYSIDEELAVARSVLVFLDIEDTAKKAKKGGGAHVTPAMKDSVQRLRAELASLSFAGEITKCADGRAPTDDEDLALVTWALEGIATSLASRFAHHDDPVHAWICMKAPKNVDPMNLVELRRPKKDFPELFVGPEHERRERDGFRLTDRRKSARQVEWELDYCLLCHERDKDSCSKGLRDNKTKEIKKNGLGVPLVGCPLDEKISEMHTLRRDGDVLGSLALVTLDNPMCPGTGHRICNDCMKACVFQKQEPVNIPEVETRVLSETLALPWGVEIFGLLTRWNPLNIERPFPLPYNGKKVLIVGIGPAGYTLAHHLTREGFSVTSVDGLKLEPLPAALTGGPPADGGDGRRRAPTPIKDFGVLYQELDERILLGFGGVSEYGITVRWDKNFLTLLYLTLARNPLLKMYGGVRFGGTLTLEESWELGFDHVAIAAGAGKPTIIDMKNNLARGIRKASDFLMALQLTGAYKRSSIANLQVTLPAIVIGGGLTAIDTATELIAYYPVQIEKTRERVERLNAELGPEKVRAAFDDEEWFSIQTQLDHARELDTERKRAARAGETAKVSELVDKWGGVTLVYRKNLQDSPAYRLNHEEVAKSLEEGVRYVENLSPTEAVLDATGHVDAILFKHADGREVRLPARTVCVAAGTSPNVTYEREYEGSFKLDGRGQFFATHKAVRVGGKMTVEPSTTGEGFFTSYTDGEHVVSFYGDNHPFYAGSVVRAMASAKHGFKHVAQLFDVNAAGDRAELTRFQAKIDDLLLATVTEVNRLTDTIVEVVVRAPLAARRFRPGQFYRLQNFESIAPVVGDAAHPTRLAMEGLALTGAWVDEENGLLGTIVLEMGSSSRLCAALRPGEPVVLMGPTGTPTEITGSETVLLCGGGLGNAVLFSIARAFKAMGSKVIYFAGYKRGEDLFKQGEIEAHTDQIVWTTDAGVEIAPRRPQDRHFRGNIVQAMLAYGKGELGETMASLCDVKRIIAIGSDRMMDAVRAARHGVLEPLLHKDHLAIGSINSPMQCMMKEVCAQCLQKHRDPHTGKEYVVFSCYNQDQELDRVDFAHLRQRLRANSAQEKLSDMWLDGILRTRPSALINLRSKN